MMEGRRPQDDERPTRRIVHDLNNELALIIAHAEVAASQAQVATDLREQLKSIVSAARAAAALVAALAHGDTEDEAPGEPMTGKKFVDLR